MNDSGFWRNCLLILVVFCLVGMCTDVHDIKCEYAAAHNVHYDTLSKCSSNVQGGAV